MKNVDPIAVKEWMLFGYPFSKDIFTSSKKISINKIGYNYDGKNIDDAVKNIDMILNDAMIEIKNRYSKDTVFGLGLSGGWDSRIVLHYALKNNMKVKTFIFGDPRPHKFLLSRDHKSACSIAKYFNIDPPVFIRYQPLPIPEKFKRYCIEVPVAPYSFINHIPDNSFPDFDILLTGTNGGEIFGSTIPSNVLELDNDGMVNHIFNRYSTLTGTQFHKTKKWIAGILSEEEYANIYNKLYDFVTNFDNNVEAIQNFFFSHGFLHNLKHFKANFPMVKNIPEVIYYNQRFIEETRSWNPEWLINRKLHIHFYKKILPDLAKIPDQRFGIPFYYRGSKLAPILKLYFFGMFVLRWFGMRYHKITNSKEFRCFAERILAKPNPIFDELFDSSRIMALPKHMGVLVANCVKIKAVLDLLEEENYG